MENVSTESAVKDEGGERCTVEVKPDFLIKEENEEEEEVEEDAQEMARMNFEVIMEGLFIGFT